jgi:hypothetical protein
MNKPIYLKGECQHCAGHIEFPAEAAGTSVECPHCGATTELLLAAPPPEPPLIPVKTLVFTVLTLLILIGGLVGAMIAVQRAKKIVHKTRSTTANSNAISAVTNQPAPKKDMIAEAGFRVSDIKFEKTPGNSLVNATGDIVNLRRQQRFGVKLELNLLDSAGKIVGTATDYQQVIETNGTWHFKALVVNSKAAKAVAAKITEDQ